MGDILSPPQLLPDPPHLYTHPTSNTASLSLSLLKDNIKRKIKVKTNKQNLNKVKKTKQNKKNNKQQIVVFAKNPATITYAWKMLPCLTKIFACSEFPQESQHFTLVKQQRAF